MTTTSSGRLAAQPTRNGLLWQAGVILATALALTVNVLASTLPLNGQDTGAISDRFSVYFVPAGYVFAIWGLIYVGWIAYSIYQALPAQRDSALLRDIAPWYILSGLANAAWLFAWHYNQFVLSIVVMLVLLAALIVIYRRLEAQRPASRAEFWTVYATFSVYLGWISVATIANATSVLDFVGWNGFGLSEPLWAVIMLAVAAALGLFFSVRYADVGYVAVLVWAFVGIAVKHSGTPLVAVTAGVAAALLALSLFVTVPRRRRLTARP